MELRFGPAESLVLTSVVHRTGPQLSFLFPDQVGELYEVNTAAHAVALADHPGREHPGRRGASHAVSLHATKIEANGSHLPNRRLQRIHRQCLPDPGRPQRCQLVRQQRRQLGWSTSDEARAASPCTSSSITSCAPRRTHTARSARPGRRCLRGWLSQIPRIEPCVVGRDRRPDDSKPRRRGELRSKRRRCERARWTPARGRRGARGGVRRRRGGRRGATCSPPRAAAPPRWRAPRRRRRPRRRGPHAAHALPTTAAISASTLNGCPRCEHHAAADLTRGPIPGLADDSAVVFVSCVLEYVGTSPRRWPRSGGSPAPTTTSSS
jgi:hypothetical protein